MKRTKKPPTADRCIRVGMGSRPMTPSISVQFGIVQNVVRAAQNPGPGPGPAKRLVQIEVPDQGQDWRLVAQ
jgi:hypothetical protein